MRLFAGRHGADSFAGNMRCCGGGWCFMKPTRHGCSRAVVQITTCYVISQYGTGMWPPSSTQQENNRQTVVA